LGADSFRAHVIADTSLRSSACAVAVRKGVKQAAVPSGARLKFDIETQSAVRIIHRRVVTACHDCYRAKKILMSVCGSQLLSGGGPFALYLSAPHDALSLDFEEIGEIASERNFEIEADLPRTVIGNVDIFMHAAVDMAPEDQPQSILRYVSTGGRDR
jgi:hypothetical protein